MARGAHPAAQAPVSPAPATPVISAASAAEWEQWLVKNHAKSTGVWLRIFKRAAGVKTISHAEALEEALCHGWIDGQKKSHDAVSWIQKFTPRRPKSIWSKINTEHAERLIKSGRMRAGGRAAIAAAQSDGRWQAAYDSPRKAAIPADFLGELSKNRTAKLFFETLNKANLYAIAWRLQTAKKTETRERRKKALLEMLARGEKFHG